MELTSDGSVRRPMEKSTCKDKSMVAMDTVVRAVVGMGLKIMLAKEGRAVNGRGV